MSDTSAERIEALRRKLRALEALASDPSATGPEARTARQMAERLRLKLMRLLHDAGQDTRSAEAFRGRAAANSVPPRPPRPAPATAAAPASQRRRAAAAEWLAQNSSAVIFFVFMLGAFVVQAHQQSTPAPTPPDPIAWLNEPRTVPQLPAPSRTPMSEICMKRIPRGYVAVHDSIRKEWFLVPAAQSKNYQTERYRYTAAQFQAWMAELPCPW